MATAAPAETQTEHQLDNSGLKDFAGFRFSSAGSLLAVTNISIVVHYLASDWDGSYWLGNTTNAFDLTGTSVANLGANGFQSRVDVSNPAASGGVATFNIGNATGYNTIIFGTKYTNSNDGFKIKSLSFEATDPRLLPNEVPEPTTYALLGAGLVGLGWARRKRS